MGLFIALPILAGSRSGVFRGPCKGKSWGNTERVGCACVQPLPRPTTARLGEVKCIDNNGLVGLVLGERQAALSCPKGLRFQKEGFPRPIPDRQLAKSGRAGREVSVGLTWSRVENMVDG